MIRDDPGRTGHPAAPTTRDTRTRPGARVEDTCGGIPAVTTTAGDARIRPGARVEDPGGAARREPVAEAPQWRVRRREAVPACPVWMLSAARQAA